MPNARQADTRPAPLWDLVEESLDEAEFLWGRWESALTSHARDLAGVSTWVEERLLGALDGVGVGLGVGAGAAGAAAFEQLLLPALVGGDARRAAAAAYALAAQGDEAGLGALLAVARSAKPGPRAAVRRALELCGAGGAGGAAPPSAALARLRREAARRPELAPLLLEVCAFQQRDAGEELLLPALRASDPELRLAAIRALRHCPSLSSRAPVAWLERDFAARDPDLREAAVEAALVLGTPAAWRRCLELAAATTAEARPYMVLVALLGTEREQRVLFDALEADGGRIRQHALHALAFAGTLAAAEACLQAMRDGAVAGLAAEGFCAITGLDLAAERLVVEPPPARAEPIPFEDEDLDADLVPSADDLLPLPDPDGVARWWSAARARFAAGRRHAGGHLAGRSTELAGLQRVLEGGPMRRRRAAALELAVRTGGRYQVETRAFTADQRRQMRAFAGLRRAEQPGARTGDGARASRGPARSFSAA